jgi:two-component sensor histidine kinase/DNA-binding response OmpR family regulator
MPKKIQILYIDDNPMDRSLVKDSLEQEHGGFIVTEAKSEKEFLENINSKDFDIILTDFNILGYEGLQVLDTVLKKKMSTPVIIVTGTGSEAIAVESMKRGAADYVIKSPQHIRKLPEMIFKVLETKSIKQEKDQAVKALLTNQQNLNLIMENSTCGMMVLDLQGKILFVNKKAEDIFQNKTEFLTNEILGIPSDEDLIEIDIQRENGENRVAEIRIASTEWEGKPAQLMIINDITRYKEAEKEIKKQTAIIEKQLKKSEEQRMANTIILNDLNITTQQLKQEISERKKFELRQKILYKISNAVLRTEDLEELYNKIHSLLSEVIDVTNFYIALFDEKKGEITFPYYVDEKDNAPKSVKRENSKGLTEYVMRTGKSLHTTKIEEYKLKQMGIELTGSISKCWLGVPLKINDQIIGIIALQSYDDPHQYVEEDVQLMTFVSDEIAYGIFRKQHQMEIKANLVEKESLIQELFHRTKNNMQVISSMLKIQERHSKGEELKITLNDINNRIKSMSLVHKNLYKSNDLSNINLNEYIHDLYTMLVQSKDNNTRIVPVFELSDIYVLIDVAMPLGLILTELLTNVFKHAFPEQSEGKINIRLHRSNGEINLHVEDNGIGITEELDLRKLQSLGLQTMFTLAEYQLMAKITYKSENGLKWHLSFKDNLQSERVKYK